MELPACSRGRVGVGPPLLWQISRVWGKPPCHGPFSLCDTGLEACRRCAVAASGSLVSIASWGLYRVVRA